MITSEDDSKELFEIHPDQIFRDEKNGPVLHQEHCHDISLYKLIKL